MAQEGGLFGGRWQTLAPVASGHQGHVYRVRDESGALEGIWALKHIHAKDERARFLNEVRGLKRLSPHPNVLSLIDHSPLDEEADLERMYLVTPLICGRPLTEPDALALFAGHLEATARLGLILARALAHIHAHDVVHRDIKPWNVLLRDDTPESACIVDFGTCLLRIEDHTGERVEIAPPRHVALDVYGLGKLLYYLLAGGKLLQSSLAIDEGFREAFVTDALSALFYDHLERMICPLKRRYLNMENVEAAMKEIIAASEKLSLSA